MRTSWKVKICTAFGIAALLIAGAAAYATVYEKAMVLEEETETPMIAEASFEEKPEPMEIEPEEPEIQLYDVPLDEEVQVLIIEECGKREIDPVIILAMIFQESRFETDIIGDNGQSFGLMQIQPRWNYQRMLDLDCTDLLDPRQNVMVGIDLLDELIARDKGLEWALTAYNAGAAAANKIGCNNYAAMVIEKAGAINVLE